MKKDKIKIIQINKHESFLEIEAVCDDQKYKGILLKEGKPTFINNTHIDNS